MPAAEGFRTWVRCPPPPPYARRPAEDVGWPSRFQASARGAALDLQLGIDTPAREGGLDAGARAVQLHDHAVLVLQRDRSGSAAHRGAGLARNVVPPEV